MFAVNVRIDGANECQMRMAASKMGVGVHGVKGRGDSVQLYGVKKVWSEREVAPEAEDESRLARRLASLREEKAVAEDQPDIIDIRIQEKP